MSLIWKINGATLDSLGLRMVGGNLRTHGASTMSFERDAAFDAAEASGLAYDDNVILTWQTEGDLVNPPTQFFQGKVVTVPKYGTINDEGQVIVVEDVWGQLERTVYQESWNYGSTSVMIPKAVFGLDYTGDPVTVDTVIANVIAYAESVGINISAGTLPGGEIPVPFALDNVMCSEVIMAALRLHPDWMPWIDHTTTPPTLNVTPIATATELTYAVNGSAEIPDFSVIKRDDLLPASVRIFYDFAASEDVGGVPEIQRKGVVDKYPTGGPDSGPRVLSAIIPLQGMQMQIQKSRVQTRVIPTGPAAEGVKEYIQKKWLHLKDVDPDHFTVDGFELFLAADTEAHPDPISARAPRLVPTTVSEIPRELVRGSIEDWMRKKVGRVNIQCGISAAAEATEAELGQIAKETPPISVIATNATTNLYKGITQWTAAEDVPVGIAQAVYQAIHSASQYQGSITVAADDIPTTRVIGKKLNLSGGVTAWLTMGAPIHAMDWDVDKGTAKISFGPNPSLAPTDFLELQRIIRGREPTWMSSEERTSNQHGASASASAGGDTVTGYEHPSTEIGAGGGSAGAFALPFHASYNAASGKISVLGGAYQVGDDGAWVVLPPTAATTGSFVYLVITQDAARAVTAVSISIVAEALDRIVVSGSGVTSNVPLAELVTVSSVTSLIQRRHGNFTLGLHQIDGDVVRWTDTLVGTIPTPPPPPDP
jgi:hypothetical protein